MWGLQEKVQSNEGIPLFYLAGVIQLFCYLKKKKEKSNLWKE